jgi:hypothetical protein
MELHICGLDLLYSVVSVLLKVFQSVVMVTSSSIYKLRGLLEAVRWAGLLFCFGEKDQVVWWRRSDDCSSEDRSFYRPRTASSAFGSRQQLARVVPVFDVCKSFSLQYSLSSVIATPNFLNIPSTVP